jgi:WD40 repeat protein
MADVFISYAREDQEFVRRLVAALEDRGREAWIDWQDIEPSDTWWQSVAEAINAADAVLFIASPDSVASEICQREVQHAVIQRKRLIAVVDRDVEDLHIPEEISEVNWIFLRPQDDWDEGLVKLVRALDLDIELIRLHTRVLTRAEAWRLSGRRPTPLLRGEELRAAERWVDLAASGAEPKPTALQTEFVTASRRAVSQRQRRIVVGSLTVAAIAVGLAIFAFIQRTEARQQARLAESRQLAASAEADLSSDPEQSIALAADGVRVQPTPQAIHALSNALATSRLRLDLRGPSPVDAVAFSPNGSELAVGSDDGSVRMWRLADHRVLWSEGRGEPAVSSLTFAQGGDVLVVGRNSESAAEPSGCPVEVLNVASGGIERRLGSAGVGYCQRFVGFIGSGREVAVGTDGGAVQFWNVDTGQALGAPVQVMQPEGGLSLATGMTLSSDGKLLAMVGLHSVQVDTVRPLDTLATIQSASGGAFNPMAVAFSPDNAQLLISGEYGTTLYNLTPQFSTDLYSQAGETQSAAWAGDGRVLAAAAGFIGIDVWSSSTRLVEVFHGSSTDAFSSVAFSSTGLLAGGSRDGSTRVWDPDPDKPDSTLTLPADSSVGQAYEAPGVGLAALGDAHYGVVVVDNSGREVRTLTPDGDGPFAVGTRGVLAFTRSNYLYVWRLRTGRVLRRWEVPPSSAPGSLQYANLAVSADGSSAATISASGLITVFSSHGILTKAVPIEGVHSSGISMSPDGRLLAVTDASGVEILSTSDLKVVRSETGIAASFSAGGAFIAIQRPSLSIAVIRTGGWQTQAVLQGEPAFAPQMSFSPGNRLIAAMSNDGVVRVWDASDAASIATRQVIESSLQAQRIEVPPVVLTASGFALVGVNSVTPAGMGVVGVNAYHVCDQCLSANALLRQADARQKEIAAVTAPRS